jgi:hypothetical protein
MVDVLLLLGLLGGVVIVGHWVVHSVRTVVLRQRLTPGLSDLVLFGVSYGCMVVYAVGRHDAPAILFFIGATLWVFGGIADERGRRVPPKPRW